MIFESDVQHKIPTKFLLEAFKLDLINIDADSHEKIAWKCIKNHIWVDKIVNRTRFNQNCPKCELKNV